MDLLFNPAKFFYDLLRIMANLINTIVSVCEQLCGLPDSKENNLFANLMNPASSTGKTMAIMFGAFIIFAGLLSFCAAVYESFKVKGLEGIAVQKPYVEVCKAIMHMAVVAALFYTIILIVGEFGQLFKGVLSGGAQLGSEALKQCFDVSELTDENKVAFAELWKDNSIPTWGVIDGFFHGKPLKASDAFNVWQGFICIGVLVTPLLGIAMYVAKRLVNIALLYVISPVAFGMYPVDDGHAKTEWYKDMKGALLGGVLMMIMLQVFVAFAGAINEPVEFGADGTVIRGMLIVADNTMMDGIVKAIITGAGVAMVLGLTQQLLKYLGCDDKLLATVNSVSPTRALKAIGRGVKNTVNKHRDKPVGDDKNAEKGSDAGQKELEGKSKKIASSRQKYMQNRMKGNNGGANGGGTKGGDNGKSDSGDGAATMPRIKRNSGFGKMKPAPNQESAVPSKNKERGKILSKIKSRSENKEKNNAGKDKKGGKDIEAFNAALDKFAKKLNKTFKQQKDGKGKPKENVKKVRKVNQNVINKLDTNNKNNVNVKVKKGDKSKKFKIDNKVSTNVKNQINNTSKGKDNSGALKTELTGVKRKMNENIAKLRKINTHLINLPRKVSKDVNNKIKK